MNQLLLGTAKVDITPKHPVPLAGFASRGNKPFEAVRHRIYARILRFRHHGPAGKTAALIVSADLLWWGSERVPALKRRIWSRYGIPEHAILLHGTHSHSGPQTSAEFSELLGGFDEDYALELERLVLNGIGAAEDNMEPVTVAYGAGSCELGVHRRLMVDGQCVVQANREGPYDAETAVVRYSDSEGRVKALLVHHACHPTVTPDNLVSSEFCGVAMETAEAELGGGAVAAFLQGACADVNPAKDGELFFDGTDRDVRELGERLAREVGRIIRAPMRLLNDCPLSPVSHKVDLPLRQLPAADELRALVNEPWVKGEWSRRLLERPEKLQPSLPLDMTLLHLAEGVSLLTFNCELVTEYGLFAKAASPAPLLPVGYTNGMIGYVTTAKQLEEGGYEPDWSTEYFLMPAPFAPAAEARVRDGITAIIGRGYHAD